MHQLWNFAHVCAWGDGTEVWMMKYRVVVRGGGGAGRGVNHVEQ